MEKGGVNLYGMVVNDTNTNIDVLGLASCNGVVKFGHATTREKTRRGLDDEFRDDQSRQNDRDPNNNPDPTAYVGCGMNKFNQQAIAGGWGCPNIGIHSYPRDGKWPSDFSEKSPHGPNYPDIDDDDYLGDDQADTALQAAITAAAKKVCDKNKCCKEASIKIECTGYRKGQKKPAECGTTKKVACSN